MAWKKICALLQQKLEPGRYKVWVAPLVGYATEEAFVIHAASEFVAGFVRGKFLKPLENAVAEVMGQPLPVTVTAAPVPEHRAVQAAPAVVPASLIPAESSGSAPLHMATGRDFTVCEVQAPESPTVPLAIPQAMPPATLTPSTLPVAQPLAAQTALVPTSGQHYLPLRMPESSVSLTARSWRYSFDDFVVGPCNELAFAASRSICRDSGGADILFLSSAPGLGKTHLMHAVGQQLCAECNYRLPRVEYLTAEEFVSRLVMAFKTNDTERFKARYRDVDVLLLEDIHFLQGKAKMQDELLATLKHLQEKGSKVVFSSSFAPRDIRDMSDSLLSRLHSGFLANIDRPERETRKRIVAHKARQNRITLAEDVSDLLADTIRSDVRQIESCLQNLILKAKLLKSDITMHMAWEAIQQYTSCEKSLDLEAIISYVSQGYGTSVEQMRSKSRKREFVTARNTVFYLARKHTELSLEEIGGLFNRSHSTVIKGITALEREISRESSLGRQMASAIALIERNGSIISPSL